MAVTLAAAPAPASAQSPPLTPGDLIGQGIGGTVSALACDPARTATKPLGDLAAGVSDLLCNVDVLDYSVYTVFKRADGTLVKRETRTNVGLPTLVEVGDGDISPDLTVTFIPQSTDRFRLRIDRAPLEVATLPVSVEMIADDPTNGTLPRERIGFGYDAKASRAPQVFDTEIRVGESASEPGASTLSIGWETRGVGTSLDVIGGLFNGTPDARTDPVGARLSYAPAPAEAGVDLVVGRRLAARTTTSAPTLLTADFESVEGPSELRARAVFDRLPAFIETIYEPLAPDRRKVTYSAAATVNRFTLDYTDKPGGVLDQAATVRASGLPTGMTLEQTAAKAGTFQTTGGPLGSVEVGYAQKGMPRLLPGATKPYGYVFEQGQLKSYAGRVDGLTRARFDASEPIVVDAELAARTPFIFKVDTPALKADGDLQDLPRHVLVTVDLNGGKIDYNGFGDTIDRITLADATKPAGFFPAAKPPFNRVTRIQGTVRQLPPQVAVTLKPESEEGAGFTASQAIGSLEALLSSGPADPTTALPAGESGVKVEELPSHFTAFGRVNGLREVNVKTEGTSKVSAKAKLARQKLHVIYRKILTAEAPATPPGDTTVDAQLSEIPDDISFSMDSKTGAISYRAAQGIDQVDATVTAENPIALKARRIVAKVKGIPASLDLVLVDLPNDGFGLGFTATPQVDYIEALLSGDPRATLAQAPLPPDERGVVFKDLPTEFTIHGRIDGLKQAAMLRTSQKRIYAAAKVARQKLHGIYEGPLDPTVPGTPQIKLDAKLSEVPSDIFLAFDPNEGKANYRANAGIDTLDAELTSNQPLFGPVKRIFGHVEGIPASLDLGFKPPTGSGGSFTATPSVKLVEVELTDGRVAQGFPDARSGVKLTAFPNQFEMFGRLKEVKGATFTSSNGSVKGSVDTGPLPDGSKQPFDIEARIPRGDGSITPPASIVTKISELPSHVEVDQGSSKIDYKASDPITSVEIDAHDLNSGVGSINHVDATLTGVPKDFSIATGDKTGVVVNEGAFQRIQASLWDTGDPLPAPGEDNRNKALMNTRDGQLKVFLRIFNLKKALLSDSFGTTEIDTAFSQPPAPLDFHLDNKTGTPALDSTVDVTATEVPTEAKIGIGDAGHVQGKFMTGTYLGYDANASTADVHAEIRTPKAVALLDSPNIPAHSHVCFSTGFQCDARAEQVFPTEDDDINGGTDAAVFFNDVNIVTDSDGLLRLSGKICLPPTNDKGTPTGAPAPYDCAPNTTHFITIDDLRVKNTRLEFASGNASNDDDDGGGPGEDGLLKLYLDEDETGLKVRDFRSVNTFSNDVIHIQKDADPPFRNMIVGRPFFLVLDLDTNFTPFDKPDIERYNGEQIDCRNLTVSPKILGEELDVIPVIAAFQAVDGIPDICVF